MSFDKCKQCKVAFSTYFSSVDDRTPIQGTCQCRKNICRACVTKLHLEQSDGSNVVVTCPDCNQSAFQIDNLIVNENLCESIAVIRSIRNNDAIDIDASGTGSRVVKKPRRSPRNAVPNAIIKIENASKGYFKCPRGCLFSIVTSNSACNVITCVGHSSFRSKDNPFNHRGFINFCVHCKVECPDNFSVCPCPKRKDPATKKRVLDEKNERNRNNPIILSPERPSKISRKEDKVGANIDLDNSSTPADKSSSVDEDEDEKQANSEEDDSKSEKEDGDDNRVIGGAMMPYDSNSEEEDSKSGGDDNRAIGGVMMPSLRFHPLRDLVTDWAEKSKSIIPSDRVEACMNVLFELLTLSRKSSKRRGDKRICLSDVLTACDTMKINIPEHRLDALMPVHKVVYGVQLTFSEFAELSMHYPESASLEYEDIEELEGSFTSLKAVSGDLFAKMVEAVRSLLGCFHANADEFDIKKEDDDDYSLFYAFRRIDLLDYFEYVSEEKECKKEVETLINDISNGSQPLFAPHHCHMPYDELRYMVGWCWEKLYRNSYRIFPSAQKVIQQIMETVALGSCSEIQIDSRTRSHIFSDSKGLHLTINCLGRSGVFMTSEGDIWTGDYLQDPKGVEQSISDAATAVRFKEYLMNDNKEKQTTEVEEDIDYLKKVLRFVKRKIDSSEKQEIESKLGDLYNYIECRMELLEEEEAEDDGYFQGDAEEHAFNSSILNGIRRQRKFRK